MFPVLLQQHGYRTFFAGKYLNEYYSERVPKGFDSWYGLHGNSIYYNYTLNENGRLKHYQNIYLTDLLVTLNIIQSYFYYNSILSYP